MKGSLAFLSRNILYRLNSAYDDSVAAETIIGPSFSLDYLNQNKANGDY